MKRLIRWNTQYFLAEVIVLIFMFSQYKYISQENILILGRQVAVIIFAVMAVGLTTICRMIDLSVGAHIAFVTSIGVYATNQLSMDFGGMVICCVLASMGLGFIKGILLTRLEIPAIILTFGLQFILNGLVAIWVNHQKWHGNSDFSHVYKSSLFGIPIYIFIIIFCAIFVSFLLHKTYIGRYFFAVGTNDTIVRNVGLPIDTIRVICFTLSGILISISSIMLLSRTSTSQTIMGSGYLFDILIALCIGRVSFYGGKGTVTGMVLGSVSIVLLNRMLMSIEVIHVNQDLIYGIILLLLLKSDMSRKRAKLLTTYRGIE